VEDKDNTDSFLNKKYSGTSCSAQWHFLMLECLLQRGSNCLTQQPWYLVFVYKAGQVVSRRAFNQGRKWFLVAGSNERIRGSDISLPRLGWSPAASEVSAASLVSHRRRMLAASWKSPLCKVFGMRAASSSLHIVSRGRPG